MNKRKNKTRNYHFDMKDPYEHIHMATNDQLAAMLDIDAIYHDLTYGEAKEIVKEAAVRLRTKHKVPFNNEQFE